MKKADLREDIQNFSIHAQKSLIKRLRVYSIIHDVTMESIVEIAFREFLEKREKQTR